MINNYEVLIANSHKAVSDYEEKQTKIQTDARDWLLRVEPNVFVTLTFNSGMGVDDKCARRVFGTFAHKLKCQLFGRNSKKRIGMCPVIEGSDAEGESSNAKGRREQTHIHCLMKLPGKPMDYMEMVCRLWVESSEVCGNPKIYCPKSNDWFLEISTNEKRRALTNYVLKTCSLDIDAVLLDFVPLGLRSKD